MYTACLTGYILDVYDFGHETQKIKFAPKQHKAWLNAKYLTFTWLTNCKIGEQSTPVQHRNIILFDNFVLTGYQK